MLAVASVSCPYLTLFGYPPLPSLVIQVLQRIRLCLQKRDRAAADGNPVGKTLAVI